MTALALLAVVGTGAGCAAIARLLFPPTPPLAPRVHPYLVVLPGTGRGAMPLGADATAERFNRTTVGRLFGPPLLAALRRVGGVLERRSDAHLARLLWQAGFSD